MGGVFRSVCIGDSKYRLLVGLRGLALFSEVGSFAARGCTLGYPVYGPFGCDVPSRELASPFNVTWLGYMLSLDRSLIPYYASLLPGVLWPLPSQALTIISTQRPQVGEPRRI